MCYFTSLLSPLQLLLISFSVWVKIFPSAEQGINTWESEHTDSKKRNVRLALSPTVIPIKVITEGA